MTAPYERGVPLSKRFVAWFRDVPEPVYDSRVRAPREWFWPIVVPLLGIAMVLIIAGQAQQRGLWP